MFYSTYKRLGLTPNQLRTATTPVISFTGALVCPLGLITFLVHTGSRVMIVVVARSGQFPEPLQISSAVELGCMWTQFPEPLQYPPRSSLVALHEGNRHARLPSTHEANVLKIEDEERKLEGCMLTGLPTPMAPGLYCARFTERSCSSFYKPNIRRTLP
ncbi:hypothetical protein RHMOL_Rhmol01G0085900 [Rhododendron molle]|uniref:Uncharacterized protein n=1 Tax=Rhododendron molle TaxID=49168 RepID=A0ACC0PZ45_RHOML|nr:hypothetical protein RHMOL_Rhmol01G0085900 [Rhododendron molle]